MPGTRKDSQTDRRIRQHMLNSMKVESRLATEIGLLLFVRVAHVTGEFLNLAYPIGLSYPNPILTYVLRTQTRTTSERIRCNTLIFR